ncbi:MULTISPECIES: hypothetical protein [unclassified Pseudomonas]|uniref:homocitrate synthase/isopropylmalate synthase family protein n=1 Tax=unclassified Pseudomonas TaxID=196821 RepID=UPI0035C05180
MSLREDIVIEDTTLRDGEQAPGISFGRITKLKIFDALIDAGIRWIEGGIYAMGGTESRTLKEMLERTQGTDIRLVGWNRGIRADVEASLDAGYRYIHIGLPTSEIHLKNSINKSKDWLVRQACELIDVAKQRNAFVSISAEDVARSDLSFLVDYAGHICEAGADRLRLSDTIGVLTPEQYHAIIHTVTSTVDIDTQCHAHNDFGLGVSNTISGLLAGAKYFHATVNGIGERAGMPDLAQMVMSLKIQYGIDLGVKLEKLQTLCEIVAHATASRINPWQPVVGSNIFAHESGIHAKGTLNNGKSFEPYAPSLVGRERHIVVGKHSGRASIRYALDQLHIILSDDEVHHLLRLVREVSTIKSRALTLTDVAMLCSTLRRERQHEQ